MQQPGPRLRPPADAPYVGTDRACVRCGYNLKGLKVSENCPECGRPIRPKRPGSLSDQNMIYAPLGYLRTLALGTHFYLAGFITLVISWMWWLWHDRAEPAPLIVGAVAGAVWWLGVVLVTRARPLTGLSQADSAREWFWPRLLARITQACWAPAAALGVLHVRTGSDLAWWAGLGLALVALLGLVAVNLYQQHLADWADDTGQLDALRLAVLLEPAWLPVAAHVGAWGAQRFASLLDSVLAPFLLVVAFLTIVLCIVPLWISINARRQFWSVAQWAVVNHITAEERERRVKQREQEEAERALERDARREAAMSQSVAGQVAASARGPRPGQSGAATVPGVGTAPPTPKPGSKGQVIPEAPRGEAYELADE